MITKFGLILCSCIKSHHRNKAGRKFQRLSSYLVFPHVVWITVLKTICLCCSLKLAVKSFPKHPMQSILGLKGSYCQTESIQQSVYNQLLCYHCPLVKQVFPYFPSITAVESNFPSGLHFAMINNSIYVFPEKYLFIP